MQSRSSDANINTFIRKSVPGVIFLAQPKDTLRYDAVDCASPQRVGSVSAGWSKTSSPQAVGEETMPHILCVDDEQDILSVATLALEMVGGFTVSSVTNGSDAVWAAEDTQPDLILLDVMMPQMGGPATLKALRENRNTAGIPVVFMTARVQAHEVAEYLELGASAVIHKPFDPMLLPSQLKEVLQWTRTN